MRQAWTYPTSSTTPSNLDLTVASLVQRLLVVRNRVDESLGDFGVVSHVGTLLVPQRARGGTGTFEALSTSSKFKLCPRDSPD